MSPPALLTSPTPIPCSAHPEKGVGASTAPPGALEQEGEGERGHCRVVGTGWVPQPGQPAGLAGSTPEATPGCRLHFTENTATQQPPGRHRAKFSHVWFPASPAGGSGLRPTQCSVPPLEGDSAGDSLPAAGNVVILASASSSLPGFGMNYFSIFTQEQTETISQFLMKGGQELISLSTNNRTTHNTESGQEGGWGWARAPMRSHYPACLEARAQESWLQEEKETGSVLGHGDFGSSVFVINFLPRAPSPHPRAGAVTMADGRGTHGESLELRGGREHGTDSPSLLPYTVELLSLTLQYRVNQCQD